MLDLSMDSIYPYFNNLLDYEIFLSSVIVNYIIGFVIGCTLFIGMSSLKESLMEGFYIKFIYFTALKLFKENKFSILLKYR